MHHVSDGLPKSPSFDQHAKHISCMETTIHAHAVNTHAPAKRVHKSKFWGASWTSVNLHPLPAVWMFLLVSVIGIGGAIYGFSGRGFGAEAHCFGFLHAIAKCSAGITKASFPVLYIAMCRGLLTLLSMTPLDNYVPFTSHLTFHKAMAALGVLSAMVHSAAHTIRAVLKIKIHVSQTCSHLQTKVVLLDTEAKFWSSMVAVTGILLVVVLLMIGFFASPWPRNIAAVRRTRFGRFWNHHDVFMWTHRLHFVFWLLFWLHPLRTMFAKQTSSYNTGIFANTWWFLMLPTAVYIIEKLRLAYQEAGWKPELLSVRLLPCDVYEVHISKPAGWRCYPGMFAQIKIPGMSLLQWHAFTMTSAPDDEFISFLIRSHGDWTSELAGLVESGRLSAKLSNTTSYSNLSFLTKQHSGSFFPLIRSRRNISHGSSHSCSPVTTSTAGSGMQQPQTADSSSMWSRPVPLQRPDKPNATAAAPPVEVELHGSNTDPYGTIQLTLQNATDTSLDTFPVRVSDAASQALEEHDQLLPLKYDAGSRSSSSSDGSGISATAASSLSDTNALSLPSSRTSSTTSLQLVCIDSGHPSSLHHPSQHPAQAQPQDGTNPHLEDSSLTEQTPASSANSVTSVTPPLPPLPPLVPSSTGPDVGTKALPQTLHHHHRLPPLYPRSAPKLLHPQSNSAAGREVHDNFQSMQSSGDSKSSMILSKPSKRKLMQSVKESIHGIDKFGQYMVQLRGPFLSPCQEFLKYKRVVFLTGGVGITPFISILRHICYQLTNSTSNPDPEDPSEPSPEDPAIQPQPGRARFESVQLIWAVPDLSMVTWLEGTLELLAEADVHNLVSVVVYVTRPAAEGADSLSVEQLLAGRWRSRVEVRQGRPRFDQLVSDLVIQHAGQTVGVFCCGPRKLGTDISQACRARGGESSTPLRLYVEKFQV